MRKLQSSERVSNTFSLSLGRLTVAACLRCPLLESCHCWRCHSGAKWHFEKDSDVKGDVLSAQWPFCLCVCVYIGKSPVCISTEERVMWGDWDSPGSSPSPTRPSDSFTHPFWNEPSGLDWIGLVWAAPWPVLGRAVSLWDSLTVSSFRDTPPTTPIPHADIHPAWNRCRVVPWSSREDWGHRTEKVNAFSGKEGRK